MFKTIQKMLGLAPKVDLGVLVSQGATILDVRTRGEYAGGHIKGSVNIPVEQLAHQLNKLKKSQVIITCCASGMRSASAKGILTANGFTHVHNGGSWLSLSRKIS